MRFKMLAATALVAGTIGGATSASADPVAGLFNTGTNAAGTAASTGNGQDAHWALTGGTAFNGGTNGQFPIGPWLAETDTSRWLTPTANAGDNVAAVSYFYTLAFDLTGFNRNTAAFTARAAADDGGELFLNGVSLGTVGSFSSWTSGLDASSGFLAGVNTLTFRSDNGGGPAGARLEFLSSTVSALGVPEPATWALMIVGFGAVGGAMRSRRRSTKVAFAA